MNEHIVIVGGGFGGLYAARRLKNAAVDITLIDRRNHHLFQPLLYQVATGGLSPADIATPLRTLLKRQANARVLLGEVVDFDVAHNRVIMTDGAVSYDKLIVAAGAGNHYFGKDEWQKWAPSLKTMGDATEIRRRILTAFEAAERATDPETIRSHLTFVIVGGGPTGVELAGALAEVAQETLKNEFRSIDPGDARILLVQSGERILPQFDARLSESAVNSLARLGVEVVTGARVTDVGPEGVTLSRDGETVELAARTILWAAGVKASPLGKALAKATGAELDRGGRVVVEPDLSVPGYPDVFVAGDLANYAHQTGEPLPGVAQVAIQEGRYVADLIKARQRGRDKAPFRYHDPGTLATIGRGAAVGQVGRFRLTGVFAWQLWLYIHLMYQMDIENRVLVLVQWFWNFLTWRRPALLIAEQASQVEPAARRAHETGTMPRVIYETGAMPRVIYETGTMPRVG
jgi:NADH dehydrogenase